MQLVYILEKNSVIVVPKEIFALIPSLLANNGEQLESKTGVALVSTSFLTLSQRLPRPRFFNDVSYRIPNGTVTGPGFKVVDCKIPIGLIVCQYANGHGRRHIAKFPIREKMPVVVFCRLEVVEKSDEHNHRACR